MANREVELAASAGGENMFSTWLGPWQLVTVIKVVTGSALLLFQFTLINFIKQIQVGCFPIHSSINSRLCVLVCHKLCDLWQYKEHANKHAEHAQRRLGADLRLAFLTVHVCEASKFSAYRQCWRHDSTVSTEYKSSWTPCYSSCWHCFGCLHVCKPWMYVL